MSRQLFHSLEVIKYATEEIRREQWSWDHMREEQKLRWRPGSANEDAQHEVKPFPWGVDRWDNRQG